MTCIYPSVVKNPLTGADMLVRCRKCTPCRVAKRTWLETLANREYQHQLSLGRSSCFVTLTYHEDNLHRCGLCPRVYKTFLKRFRKNLSIVKHSPFSSFKYIGCGEYGDKGRPHYHFIFFGLPESTLIRDVLRKSWKNGFIQLGPLLPGGIRYVVDYISSDPNSRSDKMAQAYIDDGLYPPFHSKSLGIGNDWLCMAVRSADDRGHYKSRDRRLFFPAYYARKYGLTCDTSEMEEYNYVESYLKNVASATRTRLHGEPHEPVVFGDDVSQYISDPPYTAQLYNWSR